MNIQDYSWFTNLSELVYILILDEGLVEIFKLCNIFFLILSDLIICRASTDIGMFCDLLILSLTSVNLSTLWSWPNTNCKGTLSTLTLALPSPWLVWICCETRVSVSVCIGAIWRRLDTISSCSNHFTYKHIVYLKESKFTTIRQVEISKLHIISKTYTSYASSTQA